MGRLLSSKPYSASVQSRPAAPEKPGAEAVSLAPLPALKPAPPAPPVNPDDTHVFRNIVVGFSLAALFVRFGGLPEVIAYATHVNTYLLYVTALPAFAISLLSGGLRRTLRLRAPYWWLAFFACMALATPFSFWPGDSARLIFNYARTDLVFLVIAGGLAVQWGEIRAMFYTIAGGGVVVLMASRIFMDDSSGRIVFTASGTIGNSNDLAAHLLLVLPFLLFITMDRRRSLFVRIPVLLAIVYGLGVILGTASRGALGALLAGFLFMLWRASPAQRVLTIGGGVVLGALFMAVLPATTLSRLGSLFGEQHQEAEESGELRSYLFKQSLQYTLHHPLLGIGPGQFANYEGHTRISEGKIGAWRSNHNAFTLVSAECGIPALIFFVGGLSSAIFAVFRVHRRARRQRNLEVANACFCYLLSMVGFLAAITFLPFAYRFQLPAMIGIGGSLYLAGMRQLETEGPPAATQPGKPALV
jgi:O-antigen ligase